MRDDISENRPRAVVLNRDLLFGSRIRSVLATLGIEARFVNDTKQFIAALTDNGEATVIGILDMNGPVNWDVIGETLSGPEGVAPTLAFGPHVDAVNLGAAKAAGVTRVVSNGQFHKDMASLIERYRRQ
jgi:hypothetical protein